MAEIDQYFDKLLDRKGSDLHLSVGYPPMLRERGELVPLSDEVLTSAAMDEMLFEILTEAQRQVFERERDLDFAHQHGARARFRANYMTKTTGNGAVFRVIPTKILTAEQLALPESIITNLADREDGLILVTGPTGSGKSTTLAAMLDHINSTRYGHILTIEDPVEFVHTPKRCLITHKEVGEDADYPSFADAIRSARREDADVVLVGELRGAETMKLALELASSGVQVFATVHTNSAGATIERFINVFPADQQPQIRGRLSESLAGVVAQQLLKRADGKGRIAAHEILVGIPAIASIIREGRSSMVPSLIQSNTAYGMQTMDQALERLVNQDLVTAQDALDKAHDKESFARVPKVAASMPEVH